MPCRAAVGLYDGLIEVIELYRPAEAAVEEPS